MEPKVSPPYKGGVARSAGVVRHAETFSTIDHPVCGCAAATPPVSGGKKPSVPFLKIFAKIFGAHRPL
jgi:hypothetical protein